ncbi:hypothetical protein OJF2_12630 [Aquisphaera giovannonii]|uniref:DUF11 domain-containing protein n=1 Tax=Aquisphaera giovannonii TaxID=406548 RepID=A0A5B9VWZ2_9BACT|nr:DUF11 domain-containing protein [Aquisphaera giovannonii]QEH32782.1 hypothetical protein OJF2_12630 [Aquisphaera giovannonii]
MSRHGRNRGAEAGRRIAPAALLGLSLVAALCPDKAAAQGPAATPPPPPQTAPAPPEATPGVPLTPGPAPAASPAAAPPGTAVITPEGHAPEAGGPVLSPSTQVVRFDGPPGLGVEVLAPSPMPVPPGDGAGIATVGLERGVGYRLRLTNITERPGAELFPAIEVVGHLHRPREIDPSKYPIRVVFTDEELWGVIDRGRLLTKVIYLEEPEQAIPIKLPKDRIPVVPLNPTEQPLKVAQALGRVMAIVRVGGRRPSVEEIQAGATGDVGLDAIAAVGSTRCPFSSPEGDPCQLPCGPVCGTPPPPGRPWLPRDEYLCDGGDAGAPAGVGGEGSLQGIDPRDAVMKFDIGLGDRTKHRILPTNRVCLYAPRFAEVQVSTGTNEAIEVHGANYNRTVEVASRADGRSHANRLVQKQAAELARERRRAQDMEAKTTAGEDSSMRSLDSFLNAQHAKTGSQGQSASLARARLQPVQAKGRVRFDGIKTAESAVMKGVSVGASENVMTWQALSMTGIETPPARPGMAIIKRVSATEAEPGDTVTFTITYRNMGNTPIRSAEIVDSLLPRLEYVKGTAKGPRGTDFSASENRVGSTELKWTLPGVIAPGASGEVSFQALIR